MSARAIAWKKWVTVGCLCLLFGCERESSVAQQTVTTPNFSAMMSEPTQDYKPVVPGRVFSFPQDHQAHQDYRHEWWYLTANLTGESGQEYGVQWTQFRFATRANESSQDSQESAISSPWQSHNLYMAHTALTTNQTHLFAEKWSRSHPRLAGVDQSPFAVYVDNWRWQSSTDEMFPAVLSVETLSDSEQDKSTHFSFNLELESKAPFQLQGVDGYSIKSADGKVASYYYSQPYIDVTGEVTVNGMTEKVTGQGWLDREWSTQFLLASQQGWDWFALRLSEQVTLVLFQLRPNGEGVSFKNARFMDKQGNGFAIQSDDIDLTPVAYTNNHPTQWQINVPKHDINLLVTPLNPNSMMALSIPYWEGPVQFTGSHAGQGYLEMTGY